MLIIISILICTYIYYKYIIYRNKCISNIQHKYPNHIAFIMDGNGRWGKKKVNNRLYGHINGTYNLENICKECFSNGSSYLTFFVFSEQNWKRSYKEAMSIFLIILNMIDKLFNNTLYRIIIQGRFDRIPDKLKNALYNIQEKTKHYTNTIILCIDYSGRSEIVAACKKIIDSGIKPTTENITKQMYITDIPDPDLVIRTSGEKRISDFLLWQICNSELYFCDTLWPDFNINHLQDAIIDYNQRDRRFGGINLKK